MSTSFKFVQDKIIGTYISTGIGPFRITDSGYASFPISLGYVYLFFCDNIYRQIKVMECIIILKKQLVHIKL